MGLRLVSTEMKMDMFQVAFEGEKMTLVAGSRDRWVVLADSPTFANFHENILSFQVTSFLIHSLRLFLITMEMRELFSKVPNVQDFV